MKNTDVESGPPWIVDTDGDEDFAFKDKFVSAKIQQRDRDIVDSHIRINKQPGEKQMTLTVGIENEEEMQDYPDIWVRVSLSPENAESLKSVLEEALE